MLFSWMSMNTWNSYTSMQGNEICDPFLQKLLDFKRCTENSSARQNFSDRLLVASYFRNFVTPPPPERQSTWKKLWPSFSWPIEFSVQPWKSSNRGNGTSFPCISKKEITRHNPSAKIWWLYGHKHKLSGVIICGFRLKQFHCYCYCYCYCQQQKLKTNPWPMGWQVEAIVAIDRTHHWIFYLEWW